MTAEQVLDRLGEHRRHGRHHGQLHEPILARPAPPRRACGAPRVAHPVWRFGLIYCLQPHTQRPGVGIVGHVGRMRDTQGAIGGAYGLAGFMTVAGTAHFVWPGSYRRMRLPGGSWGPRVRGSGQRRRRAGLRGGPGHSSYPDRSGLGHRCPLRRRLPRQRHDGRTGNRPRPALRRRDVRPAPAAGPARLAGRQGRPP